MKKAQIPTPSSRSVPPKQRSKKAGILKEDWVKETPPAPEDLVTNTNKRMNQGAAHEVTITERRLKTDTGKNENIERKDRRKKSSESGAELMMEVRLTPTPEESQLTPEELSELRLMWKAARLEKEAQEAARLAKIEARKGLKAEIKAKGERSRGKGNRTSLLSCKGQLRKHHEELKDDPEHLPTTFLIKLVRCDCPRKKK